MDEARLLRSQRLDVVEIGEEGRFLITNELGQTEARTRSPSAFVCWMRVISQSSSRTSTRAPGARSGIAAEGVLDLGTVYPAPYCSGGSADAASRADRCREGLNVSLVAGGGPPFRMREAGLVTTKASTMTPFGRILSAHRSRAGYGSSAEPATSAWESWTTVMRSRIRSNPRPSWALITRRLPGRRVRGSGSVHTPLPADLGPTEPKNTPNTGGYARNTAQFKEVLALTRSYSYHGTTILVGAPRVVRGAPGFRRCWDGAPEPCPRGYQPSWLPHFKAIKVEDGDRVSYIGAMPVFNLIDQRFIAPVASEGLSPEILKLVSNERAGAAQDHTVACAGDRRLHRRAGGARPSRGRSTRSSCTRPSSCSSRASRLASTWPARRARRKHSASVRACIAVWPGEWHSTLRRSKG